MHAHARNQIRRAALVKTSLALAPSKLLGVIENNGATRQKPEARSALPKPKQPRFQNNNS
jgi:hypothetical protein